MFVINIMIQSIYKAFLNYWYPVAPVTSSEEEVICIDDFQPETDDLRKETVDPRDQIVEPREKEAVSNRASRKKNRNRAAQRIRRR